MCGRNTTKNTSLNFQCICTSNPNTSNFKNLIVNVYKIISGNGCNTSNKDCCSSNSNRLIKSNVNFSLKQWWLNNTINLNDNSIIWTKNIKRMIISCSNSIEYKRFSSFGCSSKTSNRELVVVQFNCINFCR